MNEAQMTEDQVVRQYEGLVMQIGGAMWLRWNRFVEKEELLQEGRIGVVKAHRAYRPGYGVSFMSYAYPAVHRTMKHLVTGRTRHCRGGTAVRTIAMGDAAANVLARGPHLSRGDDPRITVAMAGVAKLKPRHREAFMSHVVGGEPQESVASRLGVSHQRVQQMCEVATRKIFDFASSATGGTCNYHCDESSPNQVKKLIHKSGHFSCGYSHVETDGRTVWGINLDGSRVVSGWDVENAEYFVNRGLWVAMEAA